MLRIFVVLGVVAVVIGAVVLATPRGRSLAWAAYTRLRGRATVDDRVAELGEAARQRMYGWFNAIGMRYPPARVTLLALKEEQVLEVYVTDRSDDAGWRWVNSYEIVALSGQPGPKLVEGDRQVPEGSYEIESLNPNSRFHLAMRLNYPNDFDLSWAKHEGRSNPGSDIMIHGSDASIGCLAMGDEAIEELFVLVADVGLDNVTVVIAPRDLRFKGRDGLPTTPQWTTTLYDDIEAKLRDFPPLVSRKKLGAGTNSTGGQR